jgi:Arylsulfotransferase (ASST)
VARSSLLFSLVACQLASLCVASGASGASPPVNVFPIPGSHTATPQTQIVFRGVPISQFGSITVHGSGSGFHRGRVLGDSDGNGGSFIPLRAFRQGEVVTVTTSLNVIRGSKGTFKFTVVTFGGGIPPNHWPAAPRQRGDVQSLHSRHDLRPVQIAMRRRAPQLQGDLFLAPQFGPIQDGPMIVDGNGNLVWFKALPGDDSASDLRVQTYRGSPVLTWWQGYVTAGVGVGVDVINDTSYRQLAVVHGANGFSADLHEFELTPQGTALITTYYPVIWDASSVHGSRREIVFDSAVQEIDIPTGLLLFQWDSLDHVSLRDSYTSVPKAAGHPFDYFHINSVDQDRDGTLLISGRNTWAAYKVNRSTGDVLWRLGGKHSSFKLGNGASFAFQHDVRVRATGDRFITVFDDGAGPPTVHSQSRGVRLQLDLKHMTARDVGEYVHGPPLSASFEGNFQQLSNGYDLLGWGEQPYFSEYDSRGRQIFDGHFVGANASYRVYRFPWVGAPSTTPAVAASTSRTTTTVYASWNGDNRVVSWRVLGGAAATSLAPVATTAKRGFETATKAAAQSYVAVQGLDGAGRVLGQSATIQPRR